MDRNALEVPVIMVDTSRSLRGNVDRNGQAPEETKTHQVVPYVGTWIEMDASSNPAFCRSCRSLRGNVDRNMVLNLA